MAKGISNGIDRMVSQRKSDNQRHTEQLAKQWKELRNRLDTVLMTNNVLKGNDLRQRCLAMDQMTFLERQAHITEHWGPMYLNKVLPILQQLETLEAIIAKQPE
jgi:hypothetical protein